MLVVCRSWVCIFIFLCLNTFNLWLIKRTYVIWYGFLDDLFRHVICFYFNGLWKYKIREECKMISIVPLCYSILWTYWKVIQQHYGKETHNSPKERELWMIDVSHLWWDLKTEIFNLLHDIQHKVCFQFDPKQWKYAQVCFLSQLWSITVIHNEIKTQWIKSCCWNDSSFTLQRHGAVYLKYV